MLQYTPSCAIDKKSAWGVCSITPKYSVHNNTLSIIFYIKMNIFIILFLQNFNKIFSKTHQIAPFLKKFLGGAYPRTPLACNTIHNHANVGGLKFPQVGSNSSGIKIFSRGKCLKFLQGS